MSDQIDALRQEAAFTEAIPLAQEMLRIRLASQPEDWWEVADARRRVETLRLIASLPAEGRERLGEADAAEPLIHDHLAARRYVESSQLAQAQLAARKE